jgi:hypothetical protein
MCGWEVGICADCPMSIEKAQTARPSPGLKDEGRQEQTGQPLNPVPDGGVC